MAYIFYPQNDESFLSGESAQLDLSYVSVAVGSGVGSSIGTEDTTTLVVANFKGDTSGFEVIETVSGGKVNARIDVTFSRGEDNKIIITGKDITDPVNPLNVDPSVKEVNNGTGLQLQVPNADKSRLFSTIIYGDLLTEAEVYNTLEYWVSLSSDLIAENSISEDVIVTQTPSVSFRCSLDEYGCNISFISLILISNIQYVNGYPLDLVGFFDGLSPYVNNDGIVPQLYVEYPNISSVLIDDGVTFPSLLHHVKYLYEKYPPANYSLEEFYIRILEYSTAKYFFMGLLNSKMDTKWLQRGYQSRFITQMTDSEFSSYLNYFTDPKYGYVGMETYFIC